MHVLVSGASGLIGTALSDHLTHAGHRVTRLVRGGPVEEGTVRWDPARGTLDAAGLAAAGPLDAAVHLAGAGIGDHRWNATRKRAILDSRTSSTELLARTLAGLDPAPEVLVSASAVGVYGDRGDEVLTEASSPGTGFLAEVCRAWEAAAAPASEAGIRTVLLRTGIVLARGGGALAKQLPLFRMGLGGRIGDGTQYRSWITLEDEVAAVVHSLGDRQLAGPVNATAPHPATDAELARALGAALHRPAVLPVPAAALRLALGAEMAQELLLSGQRVLPARLGAAGFTFAQPELEGALRSVVSAP